MWTSLIGVYSPALKDSREIIGEAIIAHELNIDVKDLAKFLERLTAKPMQKFQQFWVQSLANSDTEKPDEAIEQATV